MESTTTIDALSEDLLCLIFSVGGLSAKEVASASMTCRDWRRTFSTERIWQAVWRANAGALAGTEADVAARGGDSFRRAVVQQHSAVRLVREPPKQSGSIDEFTFGIDITSHGVRIFSTLCELTLESFDQNAEHGEQSVTELLCDNQLEAHKALGSAAKELRKVHREVMRDRNYSDREGDRQRMATAAADVRLRFFVKRKDGALACLYADEACKCLNDDYGFTNEYGYGLYPTWSGRSLLKRRFAYRLPGAEEHQDTHFISLAIYLTVDEGPGSWDGEEDDEEVGEEEEENPFPFVTLVVSTPKSWCRG